MSYIGHRCGCGDMDIHHRPPKPGNGTKVAICQAAGGVSCGRGCTVLEHEPPEIVPTFDTNGRPVERIIPPGEGLTTQSGTAFAVRTCGCEACAALYAAA